jgi:4-cresol dehydrogenase (hydroxylating)
MNIHAALDEWRKLLGEPHALDGDAAQQLYGQDTGANTRRIAGALKISDADILPEVMRIASRHNVPVYPISTGRNWGYGTSLPVRDGCVIIDLSGLNKILHFDDMLGVVTLEPGVTQGMLAEFLSAGSYPFLVPVTGAGPNAGLVGNALERGYGITPYTDHFGAVTDIEAVLADGSRYRTALTEAGGDDLGRLYKWGIGPYSAGLFAQSGMGIVTRMTIVLAHRPECVKICLFSLKHDALLETAVDRIRGILGKMPGTVGGLNLMNRHRVLAMSAPYPNEQRGVDGLIPDAVIEELGRQYQIFPWTGFGTLYGTSRMVSAAQKEIRSALAGVASRLVFLSPGDALTLSRLCAWIPGATGRRLRRTVGTLAKSLELVDGRPNETALPLAYWRSRRSPQGESRDPSRDGCGLIWYAPLVPMRAQGVRAYLDMVTRITRTHGMEPLITFTSINDRLFDSTVPLLFDRDDPAAVAAAAACHAELLEAGRSLGVFPYRVGVDAMGQLSRYQSDSKQFHQRLMQALDPDNLISPGRYQ